MRTLLLLLALLPHITLAEKPPESTELIRTLHEGSHFKPYTDKAAWQKRAVYLREQVLISAGLWPMPEKGPLNAVVHGRIERNDYTIEKVYFESYPGFYVTGNLYRPRGKIGPFPAVLSPHGHWTNGRLYEAPDKEVKKQLDGGWEKEADAARYPMQARCAGLARLGCIVFFYDMVGYADADPEHFPHKTTYRDLDSDLHGLSVFGLQTWDSIRSIDFLESLPDVDRKRIAITGASGGASQTIMMMVTDDRIAVAAPVNMISAGEHQGGCVCENNSLLRVGTDNVELAATFAPKPFIHPTATGDWTKDFLEQGFPEIQGTYQLFGAQANVESMRQTAPHNYNLHAREAVYNFFNKHLKLGHEGVVTEQKFTPVKPKDLSVWDAEHPRPKNAVDAVGLKKWWVEMTARQMEALKPNDVASLARFRATMEPVLRHLVATDLPSAENVVVETGAETTLDDVILRHFKVRRKEDVRWIPVTLCDPPHATGITLYLSDRPRLTRLPMGDVEPSGVAELLRAGQTVVLADVYGIGEAALPLSATPQPVEFFTGYNRTILANRVHDILTLIAWSKALPRNQPVSLAAYGSIAQVCLLARSLSGDALAHEVIGSSTTEFTATESESGGQHLPHSLRYGGIWPLASLGAPGDLTLHNVVELPVWLQSTYSAAGAADKLHLERNAKP